MKIKVILFDFFGTLVFLAQRPSFQDLSQFLKKIDFSLKEAIEIADFFHSDSFWSQSFRSWEDFVRAILNHWNKKPKEGLIKEIANYLKENVIFELYEDVKDIKTLPFRKAILTDAPRFLLDGFSFEEFEKIFTPEETKVSKPNPKAFLSAVKDLGVLPREALIVGDSLEMDIIPAKKLGIKTVLIDRNNSIKKSSVRKISSLKELKKILS